MRLLLPDLAATRRLGAALARDLRAGDAVLLEGELGAGKTELARALLRAACGDPTLVVPSPSFTLVQSYDAGALTLHHFDLWRLDGPAALAELGWEEARQEVVIVEWPDRLGKLRPPSAIELHLQTQGEARTAHLHGPGAAALAAAFNPPAGPALRPPGSFPSGTPPAS